ARIAHREIVDGLVADALRRMDVDEAAALCERLALAYGRLNDMAAVRDHAVLDERGMLAAETTTRGEPVQALVGVAERQFGTRRDAARPPELDEHRDAILQELSARAEGDRVG